MNSESPEGPHERIVGRLRFMAQWRFSDKHADDSAIVREAADELDRLRAEVEALREALAGTVHVLDALRTYGKAKYEYAQGRAGSMLRVQNVIESATAMLTPNAVFSGAGTTEHQDGGAK